jgi:hypothetical protein
MYKPFSGCVVLWRDALGVEGFMHMLCVSVCVLVWFGAICFGDGEHMCVFLGGGDFRAQAGSPHASPRLRAGGRSQWF